MSHVVAATTVTPNSQVTSTTTIFASCPKALPPLVHCRPINFRCKLLPPSQLCLPCRRPIRPARCVNGTAVGLFGSPESGIRLTGIVEMEYEVRDYELDQYGVVNNAVYASYIQHAHHLLLKEFGMDANAVAHRGLTLALKDLYLEYISPLRSGDKFVLQVKVAHCSVARVYTEHFINKLPNLEPIVRAKSTVVWLDKKYRPIRVPSEIVVKLTQLGLYDKH